MAKVKSKGTALLQSISSVYTAIAQIKSIDISGLKSETYDSVTLDGGIGKTKDPTGYVDPAMVKADIFWDPNLAGHMAFTGLVIAPTPTNFKVTYTDAGPTSEIYAGVGFGVDKKVSPADGLGASIEIVTTGLPT
jgi:hypothetical protein